MLGAAIVVFGPWMVMGITGFMVAPIGLVWSPFAALITSRMARNRGLDGGRYALAGAISSIFLLLPWLLLVIGLRRGRLHPTVLQYTYIFVHLVWLLGPVVIWGQSIAEIEFLTTLEIDFGHGSAYEPTYPVLSYSGFGLMVTSWILSACVTAKVWSSRFEGELGEIVGFRYIIPFMGAWACTLAVLGYVFFLYG